MAGVSESSQSTSSTTSVRHLNRQSPLSSVQRLGSSGGGGRSGGKSLSQSLQLTSMVDALAIIVIYLLVGTQSGGIEAPVSARIELPTAESGVPLEEATQVRIEGGYYFINDQPVTIKEIGSKLYQIRRGLSGKEMAVLIQADQKMDYRELDPLIRALSEAGIQKVKFAVIPKSPIAQTQKRL